MVIERVDSENRFDGLISSHEVRIEKPEGEKPEIALVIVVEPKRAADVREWLGANKQLDKFHYFTIEGKVVLIGASAAFKIFPDENRYKTGSKGSEAEYAMMHEDDDNLILLQVLGRKQHTSHHGHPYATEAFTGNLLGGPLYVYFNSRVHKVGRDLFVGIVDNHMIFTSDESSSVSIVHLKKKLDPPPEYIFTYHHPAPFGIPPWEILEEGVESIRTLAVA